MSRARSELAAGRSEGQRLHEVCIQQATKFLGQRGALTPVAVFDPLSEVAGKPLDDEREATLSVQGVVGATEQLVDGGETPTKRRIRNDGPIDRGPDEVLAQHSGVQVPLACGIRESSLVARRARRRAAAR